MDWMLVVSAIWGCNTKVVMVLTLGATTENMEARFHVALMVVEHHLRHSNHLCSECLCTRLAVISGVPQGETT